MNNSLAKLLTSIEPKIYDIEEKRIELKALDGVYQTIEELINQSKNSNEEILNFYDQDFIFRAIKIKNTNSKELISKYNSAKYLLKNKDSYIKELPQYQESFDFLQSLYKYLCDLYEEIRIEFRKKNEDLEIQELQNKYYSLLTKDIVFIKDIDEFLTFIEINDVEDFDRLEIYKEVLKFNLKQYTKSSKMMIDESISLNDIELMLERNNELLTKNYFDTPELKQTLNQYLKNIDYVQEENFENRKIYLTQRIKELYNNKQYFEITNYYQEVIKIEKLEEEFQKQKKYPRELLFVFKNDKSLIREFLEQIDYKYKNCILKNLLDIENEKDLAIPNRKYANNYLYIKDEFVVKVVYAFTIDGKVIILGALNKNENLDDFLAKNDVLYKNTFENIETISFIKDERDLLLKNIKLEDLVLNIDLETLDIKSGGKNAR